MQRSDNLTGEGIIFFFTPLQQVAAEMPYNIFSTGNRMYAQSGRFAKLANASDKASFDFDSVLIRFIPIHSKLRQHHAVDGYEFYELNILRIE